MFFFFFKQKTAYEMRISDWSSDVCSSDLIRRGGTGRRGSSALRNQLHQLAVRAVGEQPDRAVRVHLDLADAGAEVPAVGLVQPVAVDGHADQPLTRQRSHQQAYPQSLVQGKSVAGRVDPVGPRLLKNK